jgi:uncharacterized protein YjdB
MANHACQAKLWSCLVLAGMTGCGGSEPQAPRRVPASIAIAPEAPTVPQLLTRQLTATVADAVGHPIDGETVTFSSSDPAIVTVSPTGLLTSVGPLGSAVITAADGELTGTVTATVTQRPVQVVVTPDPIVLNRSLSVALAAAVLDGHQDTIPGIPLTFTSSAIAVVTVDVLGVVQSQGPLGTASIRVTGAGIFLDVPVTVTVIPAEISLFEDAAVLVPGEQYVIVATVVDQAGFPMPGEPLTYTSSNSAIVAVDGTGMATAGQEGSATVTVRSGDLSATVQFTVAAGP